jgi:DHA1 family multidrug resistance protein-like MFS transporter
MADFPQKMPINVKIFATLFLAVLVTTVGAGMVAPLLPIYANGLGAGGFQIGLIFGAFSLTRSIFVPYFGKLSDRKGRKPFLTAGLFIYFLLSLLYAYSKSIETLILLRLGQGFASAMILPVAQAYVGIITPKEKEGQTMGLFNTSLYIGLSIGPLLGGVVNDWYNIKVSFLSMGALTFLGFLLCVLLLPRETRPNDRDSMTRITPVAYLELLRGPKVFSLFTFRACFTTGIGVTWAFLPLLASTKFGFSSSAIGIIVMMNVFVAGLFQAPMGYLADHFSKKILVLAGGILAVISILSLSATTTFGGLVLANGLFGLAGGISFPAIMALGVIEGRRTNAMGSVMGLLALGHSIGMLFGPLIGGALVDIFSFSVIFILGALILGAGTMIFLRNY